MAGQPARGTYRGVMTLSASPAVTGAVGKARTSVLVVEDDPAIATLLVRGLRRGGYDAPASGRNRPATRHW